MLGPSVGVGGTQAAGPEVSGVTGGAPTGRRWRGGLRAQVRASRKDLSLRREADMMAFYLGLTLLVALNVTHDEDPPPLRELLLIIWGTTVGLALAHWFAFTLAALLVRDPQLAHPPGEVVASQVVMAVALALVASVVVAVAPTSAQVPTARIAVACFIGVLVTTESRSSGRALARSLAVGAGALGAAMALATVKLALG